jgi:muramidase (phage lysozyme)
MSFGNEIKDFVKAYMAAQASKSKDRYYDYLEKIAKQKAEAAALPAQVIEGGQKGYEARKALPSVGGVKEGRSVAVGDPVADDLQPHQKAFLNAVAAPESGGRYDIRYDGGAGSTFTGDQHPNVQVPLANGDYSTAAGRYQFTKSTWDDTGGGKFDPATQDRRAWELAQDRYGAVTGRPLDSDLRTQGLTPDIMKALAPTWQGFAAKPGDAAATYQDSLQRYAPKPQAALPLPVSEQPTQLASLNDPNQEYIYEQPEYAASGGLIGIRSNYRPDLPNLGRTLQAIPGVSAPAPLIPHYALGGYVDDSSDSSGDGSDEAQAYQALSTIDGGDDESTPFSAVPAATHGGLDFLQKAFGLTPGVLQVNSAGAQAFRQGVGAATPEEKAALDNAVDPKKRMDDSLRNMAGLDALYRHYRDTGDLDKAKKAAGSLLLAGKSTFAEFGDAALQAPTAHDAAKKVAEGINKSIPGVKAEVDENGNYVFTDPVTGEVKEAGKWSPAKILAAATGMKDGSLYWKTLSEFAEPEKAQSAALQKMAADKAANETLQGAMTRALNPDAPAAQAGGSDDEDAPATGKPATGAPTTPTTPAAVGTPAAPAIPTLPLEQQPTALADPSSVVPKLPVIPGGKLTGPAAAVLLKRPANLIETLTPEERKAFLGKSASVQKNMQSMYENGLKTQAQQKLSGMYQAPKDPTPAERDHIATHIDGAVTNFDEAIVKPAKKAETGKDEGLSPSDREQLRSVSQQLMHGNPGMFANDAVATAAKMTILPKDMPTIPVDENGKVDLSKVPQGMLPFRVLPAAGNHPAMVQTKDGKTAIITPKAREAIIPVLQDSLQKIADKQQVKVKADAESARIKGQSDRGAAAVNKYMAAPGTPEPAPGSLTAPFQRTVPIGAAAVAAAQAAQARPPRVAIPNVPPPPPGRPLSVWELNQRR